VASPQIRFQRLRRVWAGAELSFHAIFALSDVIALTQVGLRASASIIDVRRSRKLRIALMRHVFAASPVTTCSPKGGSPSVSSFLDTVASAVATSALRSEPA
jgi:hypothetical protein